MTRNASVDGFMCNQLRPARERPSEFAASRRCSVETLARTHLQGLPRKYASSTCNYTKTTSAMTLPMSVAGTWTSSLLQSTAAEESETVTHAYENAKPIRFNKKGPNSHSSRPETRIGTSAATCMIYHARTCPVVLSNHW